MSHTTSWHPVGCAAHMVSLLTLPHNMSRAPQVKHKGGRKEECGKETASIPSNLQCKSREHRIGPRIHKILPLAPPPKYLRKSGRLEGDGH
jgi:hypothetical protein